ncbi:protein of unknown function [Candidatus Methylomirabilis oxygeniifera]|uniref:Uncharacterized protein n=1 Tax=Methylomirabilis oxygeniifera TaxID=671143 RepID=D5MEK5_METO1|nr:protein of unknown function [Candidatus Methylomirabilis oxyfera]
MACTIMTANTTNWHDTSVCPYFPTSALSEGADVAATRRIDVRGPMQDPTVRPENPD